MSGTENTTLITPPGVLSFAHLFKPHAAVQGQEPRFSLVLIFSPESQKTPEYQALRKAVHGAITKEWGAQKAADQAFLSRLRLPFRKAEEKQYAGYEPGHIFISPWTKSRPGVVDGRNQDMMEADVWSGQVARASVRPFAYTQSGNMGVSFALNNVQIMKKDMPRLDGRKKASDEFGLVDGDPAMADDDVPF